MMDNHKPRQDKEDRTRLSGDACYRRVFDCSPDALILILADTGSIVKANPAVKTLLGYNPEELVGQDFITLLPPMTEDSTRETLEEIRIFGGVLVQEFLCADGSKTILDMTLAVIPWDSNDLILAAFRDATDRIKAEAERERLICELQDALDRIRTLRGLIPICVSCKKIRNDGGYWERVEDYIREHSDVEFSHGICPDCARKLYPQSPQADQRPDADDSAKRDGEKR
jgi:PAS domain S-box-containing protein